MKKITFAVLAVGALALGPVAVFAETTAAPAAAPKAEAKEIIAAVDRAGAHLTSGCAVVD